MEPLANGGTCLFIDLGAPGTEKGRKAMNGKVLSKNGEKWLRHCPWQGEPTRENVRIRKLKFKLKKKLRNLYVY